MIFWLISKLPSWVIAVLPWVVGIGGLIFTISFLMTLIDLTNELVRYWLS